MTTTTPHTWPAQPMLPGQAAAPEGPVDMTMMYVMHHAFRRDLRMFAAAATATPASDRDAWRALAARWDTFSHVLHAHHTGEDTGLWPALLERATEEEAATLDAMEAEHATIDPILTASAAGLAVLAERADEAVRAELAEQLAAARDSLAHHLEHEETDAIALVQKYLTPDDLQRIEETHFKKKESPAQLARIVPWIAHQLPAEVRERLLRDHGLPMRLLWLATRGRFERLEARATRHVAAS